MYISIVEVHPRLEMHHTYHIVLYGYIILVPRLFRHCAFASFCTCTERPYAFNDGKNTCHYQLSYRVNKVQTCTNCETNYILFAIMRNNDSKTSTGSSTNTHLFFGHVAKVVYLLVEPNFFSFSFKALFSVLRRLFSLSRHAFWDSIS